MVCPNCDSEDFGPMLEEAVTGVGDGYEVTVEMVIRRCLRCGYSEEATDEEKTFVLETKRADEGRDADEEDDTGFVSQLLATVSYWMDPLLPVQKRT